MKLELTWFPSELDFQTFILKIFFWHFSDFFLLTCDVECSNNRSRGPEQFISSSFRKHKYVKKKKKRV